jgi:hypothetical protein
MSIPAWRETHCAEKDNRYFDFKHLKLYTNIDISNLVSMPLFFSSFSIRIQFIVRKYYSCGKTIHRPVNRVESHFSYSPLLYYNYRPVLKFRGNSTKVLLTEKYDSMF